MTSMCASGVRVLHRVSEVLNRALSCPSYLPVTLKLGISNLSRARHLRGNQNASRRSCSISCRQKGIVTRRRVERREGQALHQFAPIEACRGWLTQCTCPSSTCTSGPTWARHCSAIVVQSSAGDT